MSTVKSALAQKRGALTHVRSGDMVVEALRQMRENRVRSVLVIDDDVLVGIVTQGDCAGPSSSPIENRSPRWSSRRHAKRSFLLSRNRLWFSPAPAASFFTSAMRQAVAANRPLHRHRMPPPS